MHRTSLCFHLMTSSLATLPFLSPVELLKPVFPSPARRAGICRAQVNQAWALHNIQWLQELDFNTQLERVYLGLLGGNIQEHTQTESQKDQVQILPAKGWWVGSLVSRGCAGTACLQTPPNCDILHPFCWRCATIRKQHEQLLESKKEPKREPKSSSS